MVKGEVQGFGRSRVVTFVPALKIRFLALHDGTGVKAESYACLTCGSVWCQTDPEALGKVIRRDFKPPEQ
jgi:hypothetical protein